MQTDAAGNPAGHWCPTPGDKDSEDWKKIDSQLEPEHVARKLDAMVVMLDLSQLAAGYAGVGSRAQRPDVMLKIVLYEITD